MQLGDVMTFANIPTNFISKRHLFRSHLSYWGSIYENVDKEAFINCNERSNCALDRTGDAGHKACGASFAPKAHRYPRSAAGGARRSGHRWR